MLYRDPNLTTELMRWLCFFFMGLASYFDWTSTNSVIKRGIGREAIPYMAWLMARTGKAFPYIFVGGKLVLMGVLLWTIKAYAGERFFIAAFILATGLYFGYVVMWNNKGVVDQHNPGE